MSEISMNQIQLDDLMKDCELSRTPFEKMLFHETAWRRPNADDTQIKIGDKVIVDITCDAEAGRSYCQTGTETHCWSLMGHEWAVIKVVDIWNDDLGADTNEGFIGCSFMIHLGRSERDHQVRKPGSMPIFDALAAVDEHTRTFLSESPLMDPRP